MPISGPVPTMLDMRDAILAADKARDGGHYNAVLWTVFAERGMGKSAKTKDADDGDPTPGFDHPDPKRNGSVALKVVDAVTGVGIAHADLFVGTSEVRASPVTTTGPDGAATFSIVPGQHVLTLRARGYGLQGVAVDVQPQKTTAQTVTLAADIADPSNGARVLAATGGDPIDALDDTMATTWTAPATTASDPGGTQSFVLRLAGSDAVRVHALQVGSYATDKSSFDALRDFTVDLSADGRVWQQVVRDEFRGERPTPSVLQLGMRHYDLHEPVSARYLRFSGRPQRPGPGRMQVGEIEAFGDAPGPRALITGARFHDDGTILLPTAVQPTEYLMRTVPGMCSPTPPTEGITAHVTTLPAGFNDGYHRIRVTGEPQSQVRGGHPDVDVTFLSRECNLVGRAARMGDESARIPRHAKYVVTESFTNVGPIIVRVDAFE